MPIPLNGVACSIQRAIQSSDIKEKVKKIELLSTRASIAFGLSGVAFTCATVYLEHATALGLLMRAVPAAVSFGACLESYSIKRCCSIVLQKTEKKDQLTAKAVYTQIYDLADELQNGLKTSIIVKWIAHKFEEMSVR